MTGISFIIPSVGKSDKLDNLIKQIDTMFSNKEIILVDNSKDKKLYKKYSNRKECIYIYEENQGVSYAKNKGAKKAKYNMLVFLDDDIVFSDSAKMINFKELYDDNKFGIAGARIIVEDIPKYLPKKYTYLAGEKDYGDKTINLPKYKYLGGCLLIIKKETFNIIGGFDVNFGHYGKNVGANEDIIIQEVVRKKGLKVLYLPQITIYHFWNEEEENAIKRIRKQGIIDRITDKKYFWHRMILKLIKYNVFIFINSNNKKLSKEKFYDLERYKSYVSGK